MAKDKRRPCPNCGEAIMASAKVCRFCGREVPPLPVPVKAKGPSLLLFLVGAIVIAGIAAAINGGTGNGATDRDDDPPARSSNLVGRFLRWEPVDESSGYAYFEVENRGSSSATATCSIRVSNDFGDFGFDSLVGERVAAGKTLSGRVALDVGEGSFTINEGTVTDC